MKALILIVSFLLPIYSYPQSTVREILEKSEEYYLRKAGGVIDFTERYKAFYLPDTFHVSKTFAWYNRGKEKVAKEIIEKSIVFFNVNKSYYSFYLNHNVYEKEIKNRSWEHIPHWNPISFFKPFYRNDKAGKLQVAQTDSNYSLLFIDQYQAHAIMIDKGNFRITKSMESTFTPRGTIYSEYIFKETVDIAKPDSLYKDFAAMQSTNRLLSRAEAAKLRNRDDKSLMAYQHKRINPDTLSLLIADSNKTVFNSQYVLLDFFFQSCLPCIESIPDLNSLHNAVDNSRLKIVGVDRLPSDAGKSQRFIDFYKIAYEVVDGTKAEKIHDLFSNSITAYPTLVLIKPDGEVAKIIVGHRSDTFNTIKEIVQP